MPGFVVHTVAPSTFGRSVLAMLIEKGADFTVRAIAPGASRESRRELHPFGRVPVLDHDGFRLYETQAIIRYLNRVISQNPLIPASALAAARMDQIMGIGDWYLFPNVTIAIAFKRIVAPRLTGSPPNEEAIAAALPDAHRVMEQLSLLLDRNAYFAGSELSLADLMIGPQLCFLTGTPEWLNLTHGRSNLVAWVERIQSRPSFERTTPKNVAAMAAEGEQTLGRQA